MEQETGETGEQATGADGRDGRMECTDVVFSSCVARKRGLIFIFVCVNDFH